MEVKVYGQDGIEAGRTVSLDPAVFDVEPNDHAVWLDVRRIQASARQGTHKAKERSEVTGSTRKLYRQKGTGYSRAGSARSPIRKSGGTIFGPRPRKYKLKVNKKTRLLARRSALTYKAREGAVRVIEDFDWDEPSTRRLGTLIDSLEASDRKVLMLTKGGSATLYRSSRNLPRVNIMDAASVSTLDVLDSRLVLVQESALEVLSGRLAGAEKTEAA